jgi:hypothetical protein
MKRLPAFLKIVLLLPAWWAMKTSYFVMDLVGRVRTHWAEPGQPSGLL